MNGKTKCKILKEIRRSIAEKNGIEYAVSECKHKGDCRGTCPKCESEVRYLENELEKRRAAGKKVAVASLALSVGMLSSCIGKKPDAASASYGAEDTKAEVTEEQLDGQMAAPESESEPPFTDELMGDIYIPPESDELMGVPLPEMGEIPDETYELGGEPLPDDTDMLEGEYPAETYETETSIGVPDPEETNG